MEAQVLTRGEILRNFTSYLPIVLAAGFIYWVFFAGGLFYLLDQWMSEELARPIAIWLPAVVIPVGFVLYVQFVGNRLSKCRLGLMGDVLHIRGQTSHGFVEENYELREIVRIIFGEELNLAERALLKLNQVGIPRTSLVRINQDLKRGRLLVQDIRGEDKVFHFIDKIYDRKSLLDLFAELIRRGVDFQTAA